jgi:DNA-binding SARP family transcriptional activator
MHELRCLGEATLRSPSGELIHFRSRKHLALLIYLALNADRAHRRERLAGLLWSDGEDSKARHSLSQALYAVRRLLGDAVRIEGEDLELSPIGLRVDALEMERSLASGDPISAAEFYRGEFLEGFWIRGAKGFEDWAGRERSRLAALARDALRQATKVARDRCDWAEVQQRADRLVQLDPFDEVAYGELMRALWIVGDRAAALERYENLKRVLAAELGSSPSKETDALAERIRERPVRGGWAGQRPCDGEYSIFHNPPFVGRKRELAALAEEWDRVATGETRTIELVGGAGIGKTRLADEFLTSLELSDVRILRSRCYEAEQSLPYGPVAESLRQLVERSDLTEVSPLWLAELARIVPEVHERYGELPEPARLEAEGGRRRLYEGIAQVLRAACEASPVLLFVDDLHWADDSSLALLHYLHRRVTNGLYLLTAHRPEELTARETAVSADFLAGKSPRVRSIRLEGLDQDESSDLLATLIGDDRDTAALSSVREKSGGNPFFAIELARSMTEQADRDHDGPTIPDSIRTLLDRRFAALSDRAAALMQQAAILGTRSRYETLRAATGLPPLEVDGVLRELTRAGVLTDVGDGLSFRHDLIREVAVAQVPASLTSALHRKAARALIRTKGDPGEIAAHLSAAGDRRRAFRYAVQGADARQAALPHAGLHKGAPATARTFRLRYAQRSSEPRST